MVFIVKMLTMLKQVLSQDALVMVSGKSANRIKVLPPPCHYSGIFAATSRHFTNTVWVGRTHRGGTVAIWRIKRRRRRRRPRSGEEKREEIADKMADRPRRPLQPTPNEEGSKGR